MHLWTSSIHSLLSSVSQRPALLWTLSRAMWDLSSSNTDAQILCLLLDRQSSLKGANELHTHACTCTSAHTCRDQPRGKCKHFIFILAPGSAHRPCTLATLFICCCWDSHLVPIGTRYVSHHLSESDVLCWHKIDSLQTHTPTACGLPSACWCWDAHLLQMLALKLLGPLSPVVYLKLQTPNSGTFFPPVLALGP